jgi:hypothetical protein
VNSRPRGTRLIAEWLRQVAHQQWIVTQFECAMQLRRRHESCCASTRLASHCSWTAIGYTGTSAVRAGALGPTLYLLAPARVVTLYGRLTARLAIVNMNSWSQWCVLAFTGARQQNKNKEIEFDAQNCRWSRERSGSRSCCA